jgi:hypothetical protein
VWLAHRAVAIALIVRHAPSFARIDPERRTICDAETGASAIDATRDPHATCPLAEMMDTREVAAYLRLKGAKDLRPRAQERHSARARHRKLLFPSCQVDAWIAGKGLSRAASAAKHDARRSSPQPRPLLEWSVRESRLGSRSCWRQSRGIDASHAATQRRRPFTGSTPTGRLQTWRCSRDARRRRCRGVSNGHTSQGLLLAAGNPTRGIQRDWRSSRG